MNCPNCPNISCQQDCTASYVLRGMTTQLDEKLLPINEQLQTLEAKMTAGEATLNQHGEDLTAQRDTITNMQKDSTASTQQLKEQTQEGLSDLQEQINGLASNQQDLRRREGRR